MSMSLCHSCVSSETDADPGLSITHPLRDRSQPDLANGETRPDRRIVCQRLSLRPAITHDSRIKPRSKEERIGATYCQTLTENSGCDLASPASSMRS